MSNKKRSADKPPSRQSLKSDRIDKETMRKVHLYNFTELKKSKEKIIKPDTTFNHTVRSLTTTINVIRLLMN
jgi:hypothetical protein